MSVKSGNKTGKRCDRCYIKHYKCNQEFPTCDKCLIEGIKCEYLREQVKKGQNRASYRDQMSIIKLRKDNKIIKPIRKKRSAEVQVQVFPIDFPLFFHNDVISDITSHIKRRAVIVNIMTILQYPSIYKPSKELDFLIYLTTKLGRVISIKEILPTFCIKPSGHVKEIQALSKLSINKYFIHINKHLFLFTKKSFFQRPRSDLLKLVLMAAGLQWVPKSSLRDAFYKYLEFFIFEKLKVSKIKYDLDTLQVLVIILYGLFDILWIQRRAPTLFKLGLNISHAIGLPHNIPRNSRLNLERRNAYTALLQMISISNLVLIPIGIDPPEPLPLSLSREIRGICTDILTPLIIQITSYFNPLIKEALLLKLKCADNIDDHFNIRENVNNNIQRVNQVSDKLVKEFLHLLSKLPNYLSGAGNQFLCNINFLRYFLIFFNLTFTFYQPLNGKYTPYHKPPSDYELAHALDICIKSLQYGIQIEAANTNYILVSMFNQCFTFLLRYYDETIYPKEYQSIIDQCYEYLDVLNDTPFANLININKILLAEMKSYHTKCS